VILGLEFEMLDDVRMFARFAWGLPRFLRHPLTREDCAKLLAKRLQTREESFLRLVQRAIFLYPRSPYRKLFQWAGLDFEDVARLVRYHGIEGALDRLYEAGVYVGLDEFKGVRALRRTGLELPVTAQDFDNPLLEKHFEGRTGGSRGVGRRLSIDFDLLTHDAACRAFFLDAFGVASRPMAVWRPVPPDASGLKQTLLHAKVGRTVERWFTQNKLSWLPGGLKYSVFTHYALYASRLLGRPLPAPEYTPIANAVDVARWLARKKSAGTPAHLDTLVSCAIRICTAAKEHGLDIAGTLLRVGGEPYTPAKARVVEEIGGRAASHYAMSETGAVAMACGDRAAPDDAHVLKGKVAVIQREKSLGGGDMPVAAFYFTTVLTSCPKIMLNVEVGDYGVLTKRRCGCPLETVGFDEHVHTIRSYEKLTSEGISFIGSSLHVLMEDVLPRAYGGDSTDYQLVEEEQDGLPRISLVVSPRLGPIDEARVVATVLQFLASPSGAHKMMADFWEQANTLRVVRREPHATSASKILPLHLIRKP
jgi:hypothetical protein